MSVNQMTKTTYPTCKTKCNTVFIRGLDKLYSLCSCGGYHNNYQAFPQPDLTKLREAYHEHMKLIAIGIGKDEYKDGEIDIIIESAGKLLRAIKEVLDAKAAEGR